MKGNIPKQPIKSKGRSSELLKTVPMQNTLKKSTLRYILSTCLLFTSSWSMWAQPFMWPGDVNGNGEVTLVDALYIGFAYGQTGPIRDQATMNWNAQQITLLWVDFFPNGVNYAFADCNGDGIIDLLDAMLVFQNIGNQTGSPIQDVFPPGTPSLDPSLSLSKNEISSFVTLDDLEDNLFLHLENPLGAVDNLVALTFTITINPLFIQEETVNFSTTNSWLIPGADDGFSLIQDPVDSNKLRVLLSRFGHENPNSGEGPLGQLSFIVEDNLSAILIDTITEVFCIENAMLIDADFNEIPVNLGCLEFNPLPAILADFTFPDVQVFPNPGNGTIHIIGAAGLELDIYSMLGQKIQSISINNDRQSVDLSSEKPGIYHLLFTSNQGRVSQKIILEP